MQCVYLDMSDAPEGAEVCHVGGWYGVFPWMLLEEERLSRHTAVVTASPQNTPGSPFGFSMLRAMPTTDWLRRSMTPFC